MLVGFMEEELGKGRLVRVWGLLEKERGLMFEI
jgi:hypothetical protein